MHTAFTFPTWLPPQKNLTGKVALIKAGGVGLNEGSGRRMNIRYAQQAGALAVIIVDGKTRSRIEAPTVFPTVKIGVDDGEFIVAAINQGILLW